MRPIKTDTFGTLNSHVSRTLNRNALGERDQTHITYETNQCTKKKSGQQIINAIRRRENSTQQKKCNRLAQLKKMVHLSYIHFFTFLLRQLAFLWLAAEICRFSSMQCGKNKDADKTRQIISSCV